MNKHKILKQVSKGLLSPREAYETLYTYPAKRANFIRMQMSIKDHIVVSGFVNALFFFPVPVALGKPFLKKYLKKAQISYEEIDDLLGKAGGSKIEVKSDEAKIEIYLF